MQASAANASSLGTTTTSSASPSTLVESKCCMLCIGGGGSGKYKITNKVVLGLVCPQCSQDERAAVHARALAAHA